MGLFSISLFCQKNVSWMNASPISNWGFDIIEQRSGDFLIFSNFDEEDFKSNPYDGRNTIYKVSPDGELLDSIAYFNDTLNQSFNRAIYSRFDKSYYVLSYAVNYNDSLTAIRNYHLLILKYNSDFELVNERVITLDDFSYYNFFSVELKEDLYSLRVSFMNAPWDNRFTELNLLRIDKQSLDTIIWNKMQIDDPWEEGAFSMTKEVEGEGYIFWGTKYYRLDKNLNMIDTIFRPEHHSSSVNISARKFDRDRYLIATDYNKRLDVPNEDVGFHIFFLDKDFQVLYSNQQEAQREYVGIGNQMMDYRKKDEIYVVTNAFLSKRGDIMIVKYNTALQPVWIKRIGMTSSSFLTAFSMVATQEGGCAITGDWEDTQKNRQSIFINISRNGDLLTSLDDIAKGGISDITMYPNPSRGYLKVNFENVKSEAVIELVDMNGRVIISKEIPKLKRHEVNFTSVPSGLYTVNVKNSSGQVIFSQKWIKY